MRKLVLATLVFLLANVLYSQQKEGKVIYERTMQMQIRINDNDAVSEALPKTQTDKFELTFGNNQSLWKHMEDDENNDDFEGNGVQIRMVGPGQNDVIFCDFSTQKKVEEREIFDKKFIIEDSIHKLTWKLTGETETILNHVCQKATAQNISQRMQMTMDNGKMERKEITDTTTIIAWFTTDVPVSAGPEVPGQLPGLILGLDMNNGRIQYKATELNQKGDLASIKAPTRGKKVTPAEFNEERSKMLDEMQKNNQGGGPNRIIIRN